MREIRLSGSEGGGGNASPYPYSARTELAKDPIPVSKHSIEMAGTSPAMTGLAPRAVRQQQGRLVLIRVAQTRCLYDS
jgi:hypothetical protein